MSAAAIAEAMEKAGCTLAQVVQALKDYEDSRKAKGRAANARRQAEFRARRNGNNASNADNAVTERNENNAVTPVTGVTEIEAPSRARSLCEDSNIKNTNSNELVQKNAPKVRASRIRPDWQPSDEVMRYAVSELGAAGASRAVEEFRDYWGGEGGARAAKANWDMTFRNRVRQLKDWAKPRAGPNGRPKRDGYTEAIFELMGGNYEPDHHSQDYGSGDFASGVVIDN